YSDSSAHTRDLHSFPTRRSSDLCLDKQWQNWADAWMSKKDPKITGVGIGYMLRGDKGASNTDPFATAKTATNEWVVSPAHVMVRSEEHTSELQSLAYLVCRLLLE